LDNNLNFFIQDLSQQLGSLELLAKQVVEGFIVGLHKSPFHGFSVEFAEHRLYNNGESVKNIDWKLYARSDKLFVKRFEEETNLRCTIVIDSSSSMFFPLPNKKKEINNKIIFAIKSAAVLMYLLKKQRDAVGLSLFSDKLDLLTPSKTTTAHHKLIYYELEKLLKATITDAPKKTFVADALHQIADNIHKRSLVIIFSDMFDNSDEKKEDIFSALQHFRYNKHEVVLFHVYDKSKEIEFNFENRPYKFIDLETHKELKINPYDVKNNYIKKISNYQNNLKLKCGQYNIDYIEADINLGYEQILLPYLLKRSKLY
jgi:uncharacterized protein (DUF58 family)